jgi:hypothetical protein
MHFAAPLHVIALSEARDVLCELHGNRRFGYLPTFVSASPEPEHPLVADIKRVRDAVRFALRGRPHAVLAPDALAVALDPFLRIVQSRDTSGTSPASPCIVSTTPPNYRSLEAHRGRSAYQNCRLALCLADSLVG